MTGGDLPTNAHLGLLSCCLQMAEFSDVTWKNEDTCEAGLAFMGFPPALVDAIIGAILC